MPTTIDKVRSVASTTTQHISVSVPAVSMIPPMAPPTPTGVPAPFPYIGRSATAGKTSSKLKVAKGKTLIKGSAMSVDPPGNQPSQPAPMHDVVTMQVNAKVHV